MPAIIFADLLLLWNRWVGFRVSGRRGPWCIILCERLRCAALADGSRERIGLRARAIERVAAHFRDRLGIIGFAEHRTRWPAT